MTENGAELLHLAGVEKRYRTHLVLAIDSLSLSQGERILIAGDNGSGKSTLLRLLAGVLMPDKGTIRRNADLRNAGTGYLPQNGGLYPDIALRGNLLLRAELYGMAPQNPEDCPHVRALGLLPVLDKRFGELSGGYQRLAALGAALFTRPDFLILDEPYANLDDHNRGMVEAKLEEVFQGLRLAVVALPTAEPLTLFTRVLYLHKGSLRCEEP